MDWYNVTLVAPEAGPTFLPPSARQGLKPPTRCDTGVVLSPAEVAASAALSPIWYIDGDSSAADQLKVWLAATEWCNTGFWAINPAGKPQPAGGNGTSSGVYIPAMVSN